MEAYGKAIRALKRAGELDKSVQHRQVKYLNNQLEADHGALKRLINPTRGGQDAAYGIGDDQRLRSHAHDPQAAMPHARIGNDRRSAFCEPTLPPRRLIRRDSRGMLRLRLANATEPNI